MRAARRLLLDTHCFLWWKTDDGRLTQASRRAIAAADVVFVSAASAWEIAIKARLGRIEPSADFAGGVAEPQNLPDRHRDPFDRMLIAQARVEGLTLVTHDRQLAPYEVELLWT